MPNPITRRRTSAKRSYLLYDSFGGSLAAGGINSTQGTAPSDVDAPGSLRTVTDTESKLSISGSKLVFAGGKAAPAYGDPGLWGPISVSRTPGRLLAFDVLYSNAGTTITALIGLDTDQASFATEARIRFATAGSIDINDGTAWIVAGDWLVNTAYRVVIALRATGHQVFVKGGTFAEWTLLPPVAAGASALLAAAIAHYSGIGWLSNLRVPAELWLAAPFASDSFAGDGALHGRLADGLGHAETSGIGAGGAGRAWAGATWTTAGGAALNTPTPGADLFDAGAGTFESGTYHWTAYGTNTIANVGNALEITYVDQANGAGLALNNSADLSANLTVGTWYQLQLDAKISVGGSAFVLLSDGAAIVYQALTSATFTTMRFVFRAVNTASYTLMMNGMGAGEVVTLDNITLVPLTFNDLHSSLAQAPTADAIIKTAITRTAGTQAGVALRLDSPTAPTNGIYVFLDGSGNIVCAKLVAGAWTVVSTTAVTYVADAPLTVDVSGTTYRIIYNAANVVTNTINEAGINSNRYFGLFSTYPGNLFSYLYLYGKTYPELTGRVLGSVPTQYAAVFGIGDSKMHAALSTWFNTLMPAIARREGPPRFAVSGYTVAQMAAKVAADLALETEIPGHILMNLGANDVAALPLEAIWKANYTSIIDACRAKWPTTPIYLARPWRRGYAAECNTVAGWIEDVAETYRGADLFKPGAGVFTSGTYSWTAYGNNTIANVGNALEITYVDQANGAGLYLNGSTDLTISPTVGVWYQLQLDAKVNAGASVNVLLYDGISAVARTVTATDMATIRFVFYCINAASYTLMMAGMGAGEVVTIDNITLKPLTNPCVCIGHDERVWLEGGDDGATMTSDGTHYSAAGNAEAVAQWRAVTAL